MGLTRMKLSYAVADLVGLDREARGWPALKIVNAIFEVMGEALGRGETIKIDGLGSFKAYEKPQTRSWVRYFFEHKRKPGTPFHLELKTIPPRKRIIFTPSKSILRYLNVHD